MFQTKDRILTVHVADEPTQIVLPPADFALVNVPESAKDTKDLYRNLWNTPTTRMTVLTFLRHKRHNKLAAMANLYGIESWEYFDTITIEYEKTLGSNNGRFVPISEQAVLFYKGDQPDASTTSWFSENRTNATNLWDVGVRPEEPKDSTYSGKFSWEVGLLLYSMCKPLAFRTMIYMLDKDHENAVAFARHLQLKIHTVVREEDQAKEIVKGYEVKYG